MLKYLTTLFWVYAFGTLYAATPSYIPTSGLQAWYGFNGNANNEHSGLFNGTVSGASLTTDRFGNNNSAYTFDGIDDYITLGTTILNGATNASVSCWIQTSSFSGVKNIWQKRRSSVGDGFYIAQNNSSLYGGLNREPSITGISYTPFTNFNSSGWTHLILNNDNGVLTLYVNGSLFSQRNLVQGALVGTQAFYIGKGFDTAPDAGGVRAFNGKIDDIAIWNRTLTPDEIGNIYQMRTVYYCKATGSLNALSTWGTNTDGSGVSPITFDSNNVIYHVVNNTSPSLGGSFKIGGNKSTLVLGDGTNAFNLIIGTFDTLSCDSMFIQNNITVTASGTVLTQKLNAHNSSTVQYNRGTTQPVAAGSYGNFVAMSSNKTLTGNTTVKNNLVMVASINCATYSLTLGTSALSTGTLNRTQGTIIGSFTRWFAASTNNAAAGLFPIDGGNRYAPLTVEFTSAPTQGGAVTCQFITGASGNNGLPQFDFANGAVYIDKPAAEGIWRLSGSGLTGGTFTTTVGVNNFVGVTNYLGLRIIRRNISNPWTLNGSAAVNTGTNTEANIIRNGMTNVYGEYGIGGDQSQNPLPVTLSAFSAKLLSNDKTTLKWQTAQEVNSDYFLVQRSTDAHTWQTRSQVNAKGYSSTTQYYNITDELEQYVGTVYYRLVQVDRNDKKQNSHIVNVTQTKPQEFTIYPNPATNQVFIEGANGETTFYNLTGLPVLVTSKQGWVSLTDLKPGIYFVKNAQKVVKLIVE